MIDTLREYMITIHPSAVVSQKARISDNVRIGAFSVVDDDVEIGEGTEIRQHVVLSNGTRIGSECTIFPGAVIASEPQDLKFQGEPTVAIIGNRTVIRECVTINRGTSHSGKAQVGDDCLIMAYSHVAHDCVVGNHVILSNASQLAGHVTIGDWAILGGVVKVVQFNNVGAHAMIGADVKVTKDIPPYTLVGRDPARLEGVNKVGLRRRGFASDVINAIENFFSIVYFGAHNVSDGLEAYTSQNPQPYKEVQDCIDFIKASKKGTIRA